MPYIKKLVMKGFKSFFSETEVPFSNGMNVVVGPNGSGKSNIADAICFVLGRLSIKSMRAAKSTNLIFAGTKDHKPASEASVTLIFDNSDKKFAIDRNEIEIQRIVRQNGQGIYRINEETKTRQEVLELLATAGIDPYGFNIVLQGEISSLVKMSSEDRRKIIEEVAGISIYELRKEKSIKELEKTDERLKEVSSILRERTTYLRNLEEERKQALKFKKLQEQEKKFKASIIKRKIDEKKKELSSFESRKSEKEKAKLHEKEKADKIQEKISELQSEIERISSTIQKSSGIEQEALNTEISNIRAELAGLTVKKDNSEKRILEIEARKKRSQEAISKLEEEIEKLRKDFPQQSKRHIEIDNKKKEFSELEKQKKGFYSLKEKISSNKQVLEEKARQIQKNKNEAGFMLKEIDIVSSQLLYKDLENCKKEITKLKQDLSMKEKEYETSLSEILENEKLISVCNQEIANVEKIKKQVERLDICPLCKSKITPEHIKTVFQEADDKIKEMQEKIDSINLTKKKESVEKIREYIVTLKNKLFKAETDLIKLENVEDKKENLKKLYDEKSALESQFSEMEKELKVLESRLSEFTGIEEKYDTIFLELQEISSRTRENLNAELEFKERDLSVFKNQIKQAERDDSSIREELEETISLLVEKEKLLRKKEAEELELEKKFEKLIEKRASFSMQMNESNTLMYEQKTKISLIEQELNNLKIEKARIDAELENLEIDFQAYSGTETISMPVISLEEKLRELQNDMMNIGNVNLRALEVYDKMKEEYDAIAEKVKVLENEKLEIMKIVEEIDKKKKKTFVRTLEAINELFNRNFMQLSTKGQVYLELENPEDPFAAGLGITVKVGHGKYFDVTSLSGGEQTLVALSLIFAIQEYKPYCFYIFDEVDAALDKRNSERLAGLVKKYMKTGQYIVITHNDSIITESTVLYGVSMQEGISKILSLEI